ncbi:uncharacterized protein RCC_08855 [Ramularia collo-cygni]|uniref:Uncharacterized protein n=1 Tax=Ramularia collo-cygni TaxID=112498 RepID=A0A2D3VBT7_9PEZI|nr:uncharacterized protein RCC_08855 [Ramularia collo-cygni]CZT23145.1 uncharacterized protein RCC_08855 [Ramularia collo-cygni]
MSAFNNARNALARLETQRVAVSAAVHKINVQLRKMALNLTKAEVARLVEDKSDGPAQYVRVFKQHAEAEKRAKVDLKNLDKREEEIKTNLEKDAFDDEHLEDLMLFTEVAEDPPVGIIEDPADRPVRTWTDPKTSGKKTREVYAPSRCLEMKLTDTDFEQPKVPAKSNFAQESAAEDDGIKDLIIDRVVARATGGEQDVNLVMSGALPSGDAALPIVVDDDSEDTIVVAVPKKVKKSAETGNCEVQADDGDKDKALAAWGASFQQEDGE